ncbi:unnamed protein product [Didymodactylos carnosus]|uniref:Uncharacterized protein n=1 Tax=Didymodactylos carnosus TaxID=1234261 RepID=A0A8S2E4Q7_9BILA|nr:unnamed protein product [Didymodactylos carnosus]CAF3823605.1 unnamed protein product [Didymodactylos carnosus]
MILPKQEAVDPATVRDLMAAAQKQIQVRQLELNFTTPVAVQQRSNNAQRLAELNARIANQMGQLFQASPDERERPIHVKIDKGGRTIDTRTGEILQMQSRMPTLKANIRAQKREVFKQEFSKAAQTTVHDMGIDDGGIHFDARLGMRPTLRNRRQLSFNARGKYEEIANRMRAKSKLEKLQQEISQIAKKTGIAMENKITVIQPKKFFSETDVPDIEWWDYVILQQSSYALVSSDFSVETMLQGITKLVEHPTQLKPPSEPLKPILLPVLLTKREQKKLRRQNRSEVLKEQQEKIRLGLILPPEPKVKISNLMRVLCSDAVQDPTKIEQYVRNQMAKRLKTHEETNAARKLTAEQLREKKSKRLEEDTSGGVHVAIYRVKNLNDQAKRFKVETNCKQLHMTGCVVLCKDINVVAVEGGSKQQKKFRRLMLHRINWNTSQKGQVTNQDDDDNDDQTKDMNKCVLLWEGTVKDRAFGEMKFKNCPTENFAREHFRRHGVEQYWDIAHNDFMSSFSVYADLFRYGLYDSVVNCLQVAAIDEHSQKVSTRKVSVPQHQPISKTSPINNDTTNNSRNVRTRLTSLVLFNGGILLCGMLCFNYLIVPIILKLFHLLAGTTWNKNEQYQSLLFIQYLLKYTFNLFWLIPAFLISKIVNSFYFRDIADRVFEITTGLPSSSRPQVSKNYAHSMTDLLFSLIMQIVFLFQSTFIFLIPIPYLNTVFGYGSLCLLYSFYAFEYSWIYKGYPIRDRVKRIEQYWPYFIGFGLPLTLLSTQLSKSLIINECIFSLIFPFAIVAATLVSFTKHIKGRTTKKIIELNIFYLSIRITDKLLQLLNKLHPNSRRSRQL